MKYTIYIYCISFVLLFFCLSPSAAGQCAGDNTFTGTSSADWNTAANWSAGCVPSSFIDGTIKIQANCNMSGSGYVFNSGSVLHIDAGVTLTNSSSGLIFNGTIRGKGTYEGDLLMEGTMAPGDDDLPVWTCGDALVYEGQSYATVQLGGQCWMAENLNVGTMITGTTDMTNNNTLEKYCYNNDAANCTTYGALYQWDEMMQYTTVEGAQGICPTGWHLPTDSEWMTLEETLGMCSGTANGCSGFEGYRGTNQGSQLAGNAALWTDGALEQTAGFGNSGFNALPAGDCSTNGSFLNQSNWNFIWSSSKSGSEVWLRYFYYGLPLVGRFKFIDNSNGLTVRCVQD